MQTLSVKFSAETARRMARPPQRIPALRQILRAPAVQTKLAIGAANDPAEHEADRAASEVMRMPDSRAPASIGAAHSSSAVRRMCAGCAEEKEGTLHRHAVGPEAAGQAPEIVRRVLREPGQLLDTASRDFFEPRFGYDFSGVRVHTGNEAAQSARAINASAYTAGQDIVFGEGHHAPGGAAGARLMAHELAHVVQQGGGNAGALQRELLPHVVPTKANQPAPPSVAPQTTATAPVAATRWVHGSAGSISWIDPTSPAGAHIQDPRPGPTVSESDMLGGIQFRFSNYLHAWVLTSDSVHVAKYGFHPDSGITHGPSYMKIPSMAYASERTIRDVTENGIEGREFDQLVGARTVSPGVLGGGGGALAGAVAGGLLLGPLGAVGGAALGWLGGSATASRIWNFPPIWTKLRLRILANGTKSCRVLERSYFPSQSYYCDLARTGEYSALASQETQWENSGWDGGNPWGATRPLFRP